MLQKPVLTLVFSQECHILCLHKTSVVFAVCALQSWWSCPLNLYNVFACVFCSALTLCNSFVTSSAFALFEQVKYSFSDWRVQKLLKCFLPHVPMQARLPPPSITAAHRHKFTPCVCRAPVGSRCFPESLIACFSSGGLSGFIHQSPAAGTSAPITCNRGTHCGNGQGQSKRWLNSQPHCSTSPNKKTECLLCSRQDRKHDSQFQLQWTSDVRRTSCHSGWQTMLRVVQSEIETEWFAFRASLFHLWWEFYLCGWTWLLS